MENIQKKPAMDQSNTPVQIKDRKSHNEFNKKATEMGLDPQSSWVGGYVEYEWHHVRHLIENIIGNKKSHILEFGCNYGATSIVTAILGHSVCAVDIDQNMIELAQLNAAQYKVADKIQYRHIIPNTKLPYEDESFDAVLCNSVLEYVPLDDLNAALMEIDRVLKPGGILLIFGTSNSLYPKEVHSGKWFVNYIPSVWDNFLFRGRHPERGLNPFRVMRILKQYKNIDLDEQNNAYFKVKKLSGISALKLIILKAVNFCINPLGISVGLLTSSFSVNLKKL